MADIIERLIKDGKQIEAIAFATEFDLLERFPPVPLLKTYLKDSRKVVQNTPKGQVRIPALMILRTKSLFKQTNYELIIIMTHRMMLITRSYQH